MKSIIYFFLVFPTSFGLREAGPPIFSLPTFSRLLSTIILLLSIASFAQAQNPVLHKDLLYAAVDNRLLALDLYMPEGHPNPNLIVWVHGGAWHSGSKEDPPLDFLKEGYALASVDYRLSVEAPLPAMVYDIKAAIRWLRGHADEYGYKSEKIVIWGSSAGGHLAALVGTTNGVKELEGNIGHHTDESSDVQGIIDFFGPTDFLTILQQSTPHGINVRAPALALLMGKPVEQDSAKAALESPVFQVDPSDPPIFIAHGDQDNQVPINQSLELVGAYEKNNLPVQMEVVHGAGHGGNAFHDRELIEKILTFLNEIFQD